MAAPTRSRKAARHRVGQRTSLAPAQIRDRLYREALAAFRARGFEKVTVSELTRVTGVAKGTFFNHFPTKDHVLSAYLQDVWDSAEEEVSQEGLVGTDAIVRIMDGVGRALEADQPLARALGSRMGSLPPAPSAGEAVEGPGLLDSFRHRLQRRLEESLPFAVPLQEIGHEDLAGLLAGGLAEGIREEATAREGGVVLVPTLARRAVFLIRSAGFAAPDAPEA